MFGVSLNRLYERDGLAVPMVVYQCIQAVDLFGLNVEGIYRLSGSVPSVNKLKSMFDTGTFFGPLRFSVKANLLTFMSRYNIATIGFQEPGELFP